MIEDNFKHIEECSKQINLETIEENSKEIKESLENIKKDLEKIEESSENLIKIEENFNETKESFETNERNEKNKNNSEKIIIEKLSKDDEKALIKNKKSTTQICLSTSNNSIDLLDTILVKQDCLLADKYKSEQEKATEMQLFELKKRKMNSSWQNTINTIKKQLPKLSK